MGYPAQHQQYGQPAPQQAPLANSPFTAPGGGGAIGPKPRNLVGRTVIILPHRIDESSQFQGQVRPTLVCDVIVVDGGPVRYGDNQDRDVSKQSPPTHESMTPARWNGLYWNNGPIVDSVRSKMLGGTAVLIMGVIVQGDQGNRPYMLTTHDKDLAGNPRPEAQQRFNAALAVWQQIEAGTFVNPAPIVLNAPAAPVQPAYAAPAQYGQQYPTGPQVPSQGQYAPMAPQPAYGAPPVGAWPQQPQSAPPAPMQANLDQAPPGFDQGVWNTFAPEQRAQILSSPAYAGQQPGQVPPPGI